MDAKLVNPFIEAFVAVMPMLGFEPPKKTNMVVKNKYAVSRGVVVMVGFTKQLRGNVVYNMEDETARFIASTMMMGMPVPEFDAMAQSAISELSNMLSANAATNLTQMGLDVDISTPNLTIGEGFSLKISESQYLVIDMDLQGHSVEIAISVDRNF